MEAAELLTDKLKPFFKEKIGKDCFKRGNLVDDETYLRICNNYADWFEKNKEVIVNNAFDLYKLTGEESGYSALTTNWRSMRGWVLKSKKQRGDYKKHFTKKYIENFMKEKMSFPMLHLYQANSYGKTHFSKRFGFTGLLVVSFINIDIDLSEKRNLKDVNVTYGLSMNLGSSDSCSIEMQE